MISLRIFFWFEVGSLCVSVSLLYPPAINLIIGIVTFEHDYGLLDDDEMMRCFMYLHSISSLLRCTGTITRVGINVRPNPNSVSPHSRTRDNKPVTDQVGYLENHHNRA